MVIVGKRIIERATEGEEFPSKGKSKMSPSANTRVEITLFWVYELMVSMCYELRTCNLRYLYVAKLCLSKEANQIVPTNFVLVEHSPN